MSSVPHPRRRPQQEGIALIVVLIMVLLVTMLGIAGVRTLVMQERMASNGLDRTLALQSAERVLRNAEDVALAQSLASPTNAAFPASVPASGIRGSYSPATSCPNTNTVDGSACTAGLCSQPSPGCKPRWLDSTVTWAEVVSTAPATPASAATDSDAVLSTSLHQQYLIEYLGNTYACNSSPSAPFICKMYRITVRTQTPNTDRALVILQSNFLTL